MASAGEAATARPPRVVLTNVNTGDFFEAQANPPELEESQEATYNRLTVPGFSGQPMQLTNTGNYKVEVEFEYVVKGPPEQAEALRVRSFMFSLLHPRRGNDVPSAGAPSALFVWPGMISITCKVTKVSIKHDRFNRQMQTTHFKAKLSLEEVNNQLRTAEDVYTPGGRGAGQGLQRGTGF